MRTSNANLCLVVGLFLLLLGGLCPTATLAQKGKNKTQQKKNTPRPANNPPPQVEETTLADTTELEQDEDSLNRPALGSGKESIPLGVPFYRRNFFGTYSGYNSPYRQRVSPFLNGLAPKQQVGTLPPFGFGLPGLRPRINYDTGGYKITQPIDSLGDLRSPIQLTEREMMRIRQAEQRRDAFRGFNSDQEGTTPTNSGRLIPPIKLPPLADRLFGGSEIDIQPVGSVMLDLGGRWQRIDNPQILRRQQRNGGLFFDQQIQLNFVGKIGKKLNLNFNWDTKNTFQFDNRFLSGYTAQEEDIIQEVNVGNVSMATSNSLIQGAQNLFGVRTRMRFGKLWVNTLASQSRGTVETMRIRGGAQQRGFEIRADSYEENRHFFLAQFFRSNYERSLRTMPVVTSGVVVTRVEAYVTNRNNNTATLRNVVGLLDLGEGAPFRPNNPQISPATGAGPASNDANRLYQNATTNNTVRNVDFATGELERAFGFLKGADYELLRAARRLAPNEFTFHPNLGYISLLQPLRNDEILAVSFEYTFNGRTYQVGELTENYQQRGANDVIVMKLLRPSTIRTDIPSWDLMMKNIYSLQTQDIQRTNFQLRVIYRDDLTGQDNPSLHEGARTKDIPLVQLFEMDRLNPNNDPQPDGNFDFVEGVTVDSRNGRIIFPVLEPFGATLQRYFDPSLELQFINKYVFNELYRGTRADAILNVAKSKFFIKGSSQSATGTEIRLNGINIAPNSVQVRAGGTMLQEGMDFNVDYLGGTLRITNQAVMSSGKEIIISYERADLFNFQTRNLLGTDLEYRLSKDIRLTGTLMHLNERPNITRVSIGQEPTRNTMVGMGIGLRKESRLLTRLVDKLPLISTKAPSSIVFGTDFATLIPGANRLVRKDGGTYFVDDFEAAEIPYDLTRQPQTWSLGSTPINFRNPAAANPLEYAYRRAKLAWYTVDNTVFDQVTVGQRPPANITAQDRCNHYVRLVRFNEILRGRDAQQLNNPEMTLNLAYYPTERGMYNFNPNLLSDGSLPNPRLNYGGITKANLNDIDFDNISVQYIEFWLMDPFLPGANGQVVVQRDGRNVGINNRTGGKLFFNLGSISEDYIPDGRHGFENGLPANDNQRDTTLTPWGVVTRQPFLTNAFAAEGGARARQDVGMDGLNDEGERAQFAPFLNQVRGRVNANAFNEIQTDPSGDNFQFYLGSDADSRDLKVFDRYRFFNGMENNSPEGAGTASNSFLPDNEDLNRDNTLNDVDAYYEYELDLRPGQLERNPFVVDRVVSTDRRTSTNTADACENEPVTWYLFRIPIRTPARSFGGITNFKSMRFLRMYLTDWEQPVVLRMAHLQFVGTQYRPFDEDLAPPGLNLPREPYRAQFTVSSVNIEENGPNSAEPGRIPYREPPGFGRDQNLASNVNARLNEQSLRLCVDNLADRDARAAYKNVVLDMVNYQRIKMFVHAQAFNQATPIRDGEVSVFMRLGTDFKENYYEIEVPVQITPATVGPDVAADVIWPAQNEIDIAINDLINAKADRNRQRLSLRVPFITTIDRFRVTIMGNPDLSSVQTVMIGIRNPETDDELPRSVCIWVNELRVTGFVNQAGWAVQSRLQAQLADLAQVNGSLRYSTPFFGGIQDKLSQRSRDNSLEYDISTAVRLDKFYLEKLGFSIPMFFSLERRILTPFFNPLDPDTPLELSEESRADGDILRGLVTDRTERRSLNFTNVRKIKTKPNAKTYLWDFENFAFNFSQYQMRNTSLRTAEYIERFTRVGVVYNFNNQAQPLEPFKNVVMFNSPNLKFLRDFNFSPLPTSIIISGDVDRRFVKTQLRSADYTTAGIQPLYEKSFTFNRAYNLRWALTRQLNLDYQAQVFSIIDEPRGEINGELVRPGVTRRDSVITNLLQLGRMKNFVQQVGVQYRLPFDKFNFTDWMAGDVRYQGGYQWQAGAVGIADTLGNNMQNNNQVRLQGQADFKRLYDKSAALRRINNPGRGGQAAQVPLKGEARKLRLENRLNRLTERKQYLQTGRVVDPNQVTGPLLPGMGQLPGTATPKPNRKVEKLRGKIDKYEGKILKLVYDTARFARRIARYQTKLTDYQDQLNALVGAPTDSSKIKPTKPVDTARLSRRLAKLDTRMERLNEKIAEIVKMQEAEKAKGDPTPPSGMVQAVARLLMSVQRVSVDYSTTNSTMIPGVLVTPTFLGMDREFINPGWGFVFGSQDPGIKDQLALNGGLSRSPLQNNSFMQGRQTDLNIRATVSPLRDFDLQLRASRRASGNYSEVFRYNLANERHQSETPVRNGSYQISFSMLRTTFTRDDASNNSPLFNDFIANRTLVKGRLDALNERGDYDLNAQDVLIPSFIAAYTGRDAGSGSLSAFPAIPLPNWQLTYSGLTNVEFIKNIFRQVQLSNNYEATYSVGSYTSSLLYSADFVDFRVREQNLPLAIPDPRTGQLVPLFVMGQINLTESFNPLIGINARTVSGFNINIRYGITRNVGLNLNNAQVTEMRDDNLTIDLGYQKAGLKLPFALPGGTRVLKNDLQFRCAVTLRDTRTLQRRIADNGEQESTATMGNYNLQIKPTLQYTINQQLTAQFYFDRLINTPLISNSFRRTSTAFGVQLRYNLAAQ